MRLDSLRHLAVIDPDTACSSGTVVDYWVDPTAGRVAALSMRPVDIDQPQRISCTRVARVGRDAVMLTRGSGRTSANPELIPENWLDRRHLSSLVVYTDTGERLGRVSAAHVDPRTLELQSYELAVPLWRAWFGGQRLVSGDRIAWCGRDVLVVRTDEPAKLRPVGREDGDYTASMPEHTLGHAQPTSRNGSSVAV
jgi:uncharacterized protein YrrD